MTTTAQTPQDTAKTALDAINQLKAQATEALDQELRAIAATPHDPRACP